MSVRVWLDGEEVRFVRKVDTEAGAVRMVCRDPACEHNDAGYDGPHFGAEPDEVCEIERRGVVRVVGDWT